MDNKDARIRKIERLMRVGDYSDADNHVLSFFVDSYQRGYRWNREKAEQLIEDIYNNYKKFYKKIRKINTEDSDPGLTGYEYCLQPLVVRKIEGDGKDVYNVVDGQQRLTTLSLFFMALNEKYKENRFVHNDDEIVIRYKRNDNNPIDVNRLKTVNEKDLSIDERYAKDVYGFFGEYLDGVIEGKDEKYKGYFSFTGKENNPRRDYTEYRLNAIREMVIYNATVIWYEPNKGTEEDSFEIFNDKKIPLTGSELVKALFMNPDNYFSKEKYSDDLIKTRQIIIGNDWDRMEQQLHDPEFWNCFPHLEEMDNSARMDAVINLYIYKLLSDKEDDVEWIKNSYLNDAQFAFKEIEKMFSKELKESNNNIELMNKKWRDLKDVFEKWQLMYSPYKIEENKNEEGGCIYSVYHRIKLYQYIHRYYCINISGDSMKQAYVNLLGETADFLQILDENDYDEMIKKLNDKITDLLNRFFESSKIKCFKEVNKARCKKYDQKIRALIYDSGASETKFLIRVLLIIHSLNELEKNAGIFSRFAFADFEYKDDDSKEKWILEHIFARKTDLKKDVKIEEKFSDIKYEEEIEKIIKKISSKNDSWKAYIDYKYNGIVEPEKIEKIKTVKQGYIDEVFDRYDNLDGEEKERLLFGNGDEIGYEADTLEPEENAFLGFFKDNSLGNMGLIPKGVNTAVGNHIFRVKKNIIMEKLDAGSFIPSGTYSMFTGKYCDKDTTWGDDLWYPCHRLKYLKALIKNIGEYLGKKAEDEE